MERLQFQDIFPRHQPLGSPLPPRIERARQGGEPVHPGILADFYSRPSCYRCPAREFRSGSDLTIGDFWGIGDLRPDFDDDRGVSAVLVNTEKGREFFSRIHCTRLKMTYEDVLRRNRCLETSVTEPAARAAFFASMDSVHDTVCRLLR